MVYLSCFGVVQLGFGSVWECCIESETKNIEQVVVEDDNVLVN